MNEPRIEERQPQVVIGFEGEEIETDIEQLELRTMPESTAGFLE